MAKKIRIGSLLVENGLITNEQLELALTQQKQRGKKLGQMLVELGFVEEDQLLRLLAKQLDIPMIDLRHRQLERETVLRLPETLARRFRAILLEDDGKEYMVGLADPTDVFAVDELARILKRPVHLAVVREADLLRAIDRIYRRTEEISSLAGALEQELGAAGVELGGEASDDSSDAPVVRLIQSIFEDAVQMNASDIHIEPDEKVLRIRQRVDGMLQEQVMNEARIASALVLRLKLMSGLDISEKRLPQDGRFAVKLKGRSVDVRISTLPVQHGESVVMRLLDQSAGFLDLGQIGMPPDLLERLRRILRRPHGLILVTGPTGSGKTTTLYAALRELNSPETKIITVEDPVEYRLPRINQVQINPKIELTFARVLRAALRQDPDVVMVGEMRDQETAEIGLRASMTGHLVLSTLHTNDAITSGLRLIDMGAEPYLAAAALRAVIAQRLVRRVCESCREPYQPSRRERIWLEAVIGREAARIPLAHGPGCEHCNGTGHRGRLGVYELLELDEPLAEALRRNDPSAFTAAARARPDFRPLVRCALDYAAEGRTSLFEVLRLAEGIDLEDEPPAEAGEAPPAAGPA
jgi:MSHA biogenesis protein MshE